MKVKERSEINSKDRNVKVPFNYDLLMQIYMCYRSSLVCIGKCTILLVLFYFISKLLSRFIDYNLESLGMILKCIVFYFLSMILVVMYKICKEYKLRKYDN